MSLNGCWSATAPSGYGRDPLSLAIGAIIGGAQCVVAGTGFIGGQASARIAAAALGHIGDGVPVATALRTAQRSVRAEHPELRAHDWATLSVLGITRAPQSLGL
ncbi:CHAT domain-containing protein [Mycolicibacterium goodii]|uniref:CHAT domain-containing protein n=1 Tax=Mycolicibacterium goodii TaxID=134601 RepID=UPI001BDC2218|nr:CHAT domain-containing protein [Mycolicibacterium goodii]